MTNVFVVIQLILKALGLWEGFQSFSDQQRIAEAETKRQNREKAIEDLKNAKTPQEILDAQSRIVANKP